jgi:hypothetical protein
MGVDWRRQDVNSDSGFNLYFNYGYLLIKQKSENKLNHIGGTDT